MQTHRISPCKRGFTLMELMVAMAITVIIVTSLVFITSTAVDTWNRSRSELRASRQAKAMIDSLARDFEALIVRRGAGTDPTKAPEWLSAKSPQQSVGVKLASSNSADLIFFSSLMDRYEGDIGSANDKGGDVSCVAYRLNYKDPIDKSGKFETFVLKRLLVNPDQAFKDLLGKDDLETAFSTYASKLDDETNFVCENVFQFTVTFQVEVTKVSGTTTSLITVPVTVGQSSSGQVTKEFKFTGMGIETDAKPPGVTVDELKAGRIKAMELSLTVLTDGGIDQIRKGAFNQNEPEKFLTKNAYHYTKLVQLPSM